MALRALGLPILTKKKDEESSTDMFTRNTARKENLAETINQNQTNEKTILSQIKRTIQAETNQTA